MHQIESKTGSGKSTIGRIKKEIDSDKENNKGGCPSKLTAKDKQAIICQITTRKLDNAIQATHYINNVIISPVCPQTVRNALKENNLCSVVKLKCPLLKASLSSKVPQVCSNICKLDCGGLEKGTLVR